ncbi:MAG: rhodanese-like domain-containing protein [Methylophilaceae bacterium]|nr:rhodanese-like domain-containing protein [Methylophilaceae bacterium]
MEFISNNVLLIGLALGSGIMLIWPMLTGGSGGVPNLEPAEAVLMMNRNNPLVLDIRDDAEFAASHIADAKHIPLAKLTERIKELEKHKDKSILVYCQNGVRTTKACGILRKNAFSKLHKLQGGLNAWVAAKLPVVKA